MGVPCKMARVARSPGGCLRLGWLGGDPPSGWGSSPRRRSCPRDYLPWCIAAAAGGAGGAQGIAPPQGNTLQGLLLTSIPGWLLCWHGVSKEVHVCESTGEDVGALWPPREEQKAPLVVPRDLFFQLLFSPPLRHPILAALGAWVSAGPRPAPGLTVTLCKLGQGTILAGGWVGPWGGPPSLGAAAQCWGKYLAGIFLAWGASGHFFAGICRARAAGSALAAYHGQVRWGWEGFHSSCIMYPS